MGFAEWVSRINYLTRATYLLVLYIVFFKVVSYEIYMGILCILVCNNNKQQDNGETGVDCGGGGCAACPGIIYSYST